MNTFRAHVMGTEWVISWVQRFSYPAVLLLLIACGVGAPLSEDLIAVAGGMAVAETHGDLPLMILTVYAGKLWGDLLIHRIGWSLGPRVHRLRRFKRILTPERVVWVDHFFERWGIFAIFLARFLPGLRSPTFLLSGVSRLPLWKFTLADGVAALITAPLLTWVGYRFGLVIFQKVETSALWVLAALGMFLVLFLAIRALQHHAHSH